MVTTAQLATMRAQQTALMDKSATVTNPGTATANAYGGEDAGTATTVTTVCRVAPPTAADQRTAERVGQVVDTVVTLPYGTAVTDQSTIAVGSLSYAVTYFNTEESRQTAVRAFCRTVRN